MLTGFEKMGVAVTVWWFLVLDTEYGEIGGDAVKLREWCIPRNWEVWSRTGCHVEVAAQERGPLVRGKFHQSHGLSAAVGELDSIDLTGPG